MADGPPASGCLGPNDMLLPMTCTAASNRTSPGVRSDTTCTHIAAWWWPSACTQTPSVCALFKSKPCSALRACRLLRLLQPAAVQHHTRHSRHARPAQPLLLLLECARVSGLTLGRYLITTSPLLPGASSSCPGSDVKFGPLATTDSCMGSWALLLQTCSSWSAH